MKNAVYSSAILTLEGGREHIISDLQNLQKHSHLALKMTLNLGFSMCNTIDQSIVVLHQHTSTAKINGVNNESSTHFIYSSCFTENKLDEKNCLHL